MKKPERIEDRNVNCCDSAFIQGYNCACNDWEKFLPDIDKLCEVIEVVLLKLPHLHINSTLKDVRTIAQAIVKRIGKEE